MRLIIMFTRNTSLCMGRWGRRKHYERCSSGERQRSETFKALPDMWSCTLLLLIQVLQIMFESKMTQSIYRRIPGKCPDNWKKRFVL
jgi:hypothetical protein